MGFSFTKKDVQKIIQENFLNEENLVSSIYAYAVKPGFYLFIPKQVFLLWNSEDSKITVVYLTAFHKIKKISKISLKNDIRELKYSNGITHDKIILTPNSGKKIKFKVQKRVISITDKQTEFLHYMKEISKKD